MGRISRKRKQALEASRKGAEARRKVKNYNPDGATSPECEERSSTQQPQPAGRRLFSVTSLLLAIQAICQHGTVCSMFDLAFAREERCGLQTEIVFQCKCGFTSNVGSDTENESMNSNRAFSMGCQMGPVGFTAASTLLTVLDIPSPSTDLNSKYQMKTYEDIMKASSRIMATAAQEERRLAIEAEQFVEIEDLLPDGTIIKVKYPCITVIVDGGWSSRSYGHSYNASCGTAVVIGARTGKILSVQTMNKNCLICTRAKTNNEEPREHLCFKNYNGPSTGMEAAMILKSFEESVSIHGLVYNRFVGDGDSSVYSKVIDVYRGIKVEKIECLNHCMKNFHKKLVNISANKVPGVEIPNTERKIPGLKDRFNRIGGAIMCAINYHSDNRHENSWKELGEDILNSVRHIFGDHSYCKSYYCPADGDRRRETNLVPEMSNKSVWTELQKAITRMANMSRSLIEKMTTNRAESFMSTCNRYMEGKRKNLGQRYLYNMRIRCAALSYNTTSFWGVDAFKALFGRLPSALWLKKQIESISKRSKRISKKNRRRPSFAFLKPQGGDAHYGINPTRPDISDEELEIGIAHLRSMCYVDAYSQRILEEATRAQSDIKQWFEERIKRVTASICGEIYKRRPTTNNKGILNKILKKTRTTEAMRYGKEHESVAIQEYSTRFGKIVTPAGLVVSEEDGIFAASPDGFVGDDGIIEIKCPYSCRDGSAESWNPLKTCNGSTQLKRNHNYYYQVIMQLHVTGRKWCDFLVWTPHYFHCERIYRDEESLKIWEAMKPVLQKFWEEELAPEIVDPRSERNLPYRCPPERMGKVNKENTALNTALATTQVVNPTSSEGIELAAALVTIPAAQDQIINHAAAQISIPANHVIFQIET